MHSKATPYRSDSVLWGKESLARRHSAAIVSALCFGVLSGLAQAIVMLAADLPSLDLTRMVWSSF